MTRCTPTRIRIMSSPESFLPSGEQGFPANPSIRFSIRAASSLGILLKSIRTLVANSILNDAIHFQLPQKVLKPNRFLPSPLLDLVNILKVFS